MHGVHINDNRNQIILRLNVFLIFYSIGHGGQEVAFNGGSDFINKSFQGSPVAVECGW